MPTKTLSTTVVLAIFATTPALADPKTEAPKADTKPAAAHGEATSLNAAELKWTPAPPDLPKGAEMVVLHGDPSKKAVFSLRFKMPAGYKIPPHWHTKDEQLTILSGTFILHMGDTMDAPATTLTAGGYHFLPGKMHHAAEVKAETILQLDGTGPFDIHYLNPADNPNPIPTPAKKK